MKPQNIWVLVLAGGIVMGIALGIRHAFGLFLVPVCMAHGWGRETFSLAIAIQNLVWGLFQPFVGMIADRYGARRVIQIGALCYALGLLGMALGQTTLMFTLSTGLVIGIALACTTFGVVYGALSRMVSAEQRSWALGMAGATGGLGLFLLVPIIQLLIDHLNWNLALVSLGIACVLILPIATPLADAPVQSGPQQQSLRSALKEAFAHRGFWLLSIGFFACGFHLAFIANHLPSYLSDKGMPPTAAVTGLAIIALSNVAGTYICGLFGNRYRRKYVLFGIYVLRSIAMGAFYMLPLTTFSLYAFCAVMGLVWLGTVPLTNGVLSQIFGVRYLTTLFGFVFFGHQLGSFLGVWLGGYVFDVTHSYDIVWQLSVAIGLISAVLHYPINDAEIHRTTSRRPTFAESPT